MRIHFFFRLYLYINDITMLVLPWKNWKKYMKHIFTFDVIQFWIHYIKKWLFTIYTSYEKSFEWKKLSMFFKIRRLESKLNPLYWWTALNKQVRALNMTSTSKLSPDKTLNMISRDSTVIFKGWQLSGHRWKPSVKKFTYDLAKISSASWGHCSTVIWIQKKIIEYKGMT